MPLPLSDEAVYWTVAQVMESDLLAGAIVQADNDQIVWTNQNFITLTGYRIDQLIGHTHELLHGPGTDLDAIAQVRAQVQAGHAAPLTVLLYRKDGTPFWSRLVAIPVDPGTGQILYHAVIHFEATAEIFQERTKSAEDAIVQNRTSRLELITRVISAMSAHLDDYRQAVVALARTAVSGLAEWSYLIMFDDDGNQDFVVVVAADPAKAESARIVEAGLPGWLGTTTWAGQVPRLSQALKAGPGDPLLPVNVDVDLLAALVNLGSATPDDARRSMEALYDLGLGTWMPVPLHTRDRTLGVMVLESRNPSQFDVPTMVTTVLLRDRIGPMLNSIRQFQTGRAEPATRPEPAGTAPARPAEPTSAAPTPTDGPARPAEPEPGAERLSPPVARMFDGTELPLDDSVGLAIALRALQTSHMPVLVTAISGEVVWANDPYCRLVGWSQAELIGRSWDTVYTEQPDESHAAHVIDSLTAGNPVTATMLNRRRDGTRFWSRFFITPVHDADGEITHFFAVHMDATSTVLTEHTQAAETELAANRSSRLELITHALDALTERVDLHQAADALARTAIPELADWGFVVLFDDDGQPEYFTEIVAEPAKQESARTVRRGMPRWMEQHQALKAMALAQPDDLVLPQLVDIGALEKTIPSRRVLDALDDLGLGARLPVPLYARDQMLGLMVLEARDPDRFDVSTVVTTTLLRRRVGTMLDNIRLYQAERQTALTLQRRLQPPTAAVADLDTAAAYRPAGHRAEIGGDWYDVFPLGGRGTMLAVGDVVGHDMTAAAVMGQLSLLLRARTWSSASPGPALSTVAHALDGMRWDDVASIVSLRWQPTPDGSHVEYANLGHPAPLVRLPDGTVHRMGPAHGAPLGLHDPAVEVDQDELDLPAGSVVVLYTDGLVERRDRPLEDGLAAFARALRAAPDGSAAQIRDHLLATLVLDQPEDDLCLLVVRGRDSPTAHRPVDQVPAQLLPLDATGRACTAARS